MKENKDPVGYKAHIRSLSNATDYDSYRLVLCQASMAYVKQYYLYPNDPRISDFIKLMQSDIGKAAQPNFLTDLQYSELSSSQTLTKMTTDAIKKLEHIKPLNLDRVNQQLYNDKEASELLKNEITKFTEEVFYYNRDIHKSVERGPAPTLALKAAAGIGKTYSIINQCIGSGAIQGSIDYYVPSDVLGNQVNEDLKSDLLGIGDNPNESPPFDSVVTFRAIRGRSKFDEDGNPLCLDIARVDKASAMGISLQKNICGSCNHFTDCGYQKQFSHVTLPQFDDPIVIPELGLELDYSDIYDIAPVVNVLAHNYLFLQTPLYDKDKGSIRFSQNYCNLAIVDEKFWDKGIQEEEITATAIDNLKSDVASFVLTQLRTQKPLLKALRAKYNADEVGKAATGLLSTVADLTSTSRTPKSKKISQILFVLKDEMIRFNRDDSRCVSIGSNKDGVECVFLAQRQSLKVPDDVPMIFIDADLSPEILSLYRPNVRVVDIPTIRRATVYQVTDITNSKSSLLEKEKPTQRALSAASFIKHISTTGKTLAVTIKDLRTALTGETGYKLPKCADYHGAKLAHFGSLRGLNDFKNYSNVVIIGRMQPPAKALERQANGMWWDDPKPISRISVTLNDDGSERGLFFEDMPKAIRYKGHPHHVIRTSCHPDSRVQVLLEQIREAETTQAIDRLRLVHESKSPRAPRVFILSNIPVDIEVDQLFRWVQYQLIQQLVDESDGYIPLNKSHLMSHAKSIRTTSVAANRIKEIKHNWDWYQPTGLLKGWKLFKYRKVGGTKWSEVICCIPEDDLSRNIEILIGKRTEIVASELQGN